MPAVAQGRQGNPGEREYILELQGISKRFPGVVALDGLSFGVREAEIHAIVGENGAGKSTLVKILAGDQPVDGGVILFRGTPLRLQTPRDALDQGINTIHQELHLAPHLSAAENIFLGRFPLTRAHLVDRRRIAADSERLLQQLGVDFDVARPVSSLRIAHRQIIEIARALVLQSKVLILDEPSAVLGRHDLRILFGVLRRLKAAGTTILYISHRLEEIFDLADRVTVLRDGSHVGTREVAELNTDSLVEMMVGRPLDQLWPQRLHEPGEIALEVKGLTRRGAIHDVSLHIRRKEIVGLVGKVGSGRTEVARAIFGADPVDGGEIRVFGRPVTVTSPRDAVRQAIGLVPEDRKGEGLLLKRSVLENVTVANLWPFVRKGILNLRAEARTVGDFQEKLAIRSPGPRQLVKYLSGGNQQKVVLAKWLHSGCDILIFDEPTRGIDVRAKVEIYNLMERLVREGKAILMISSEVSEILAMADRIIVMSNGMVAGELSRQEAGASWSTVESLMEDEPASDGHAQ
ncbi:MAG: sugar ABC transporter ATP-binding protein [Acidobacteria bacterium]|nr:sugar ABC transporter ATP-binding protein [Acidobacteriota bacterium]